MPTVSVVLPTYNREATISRAVDSVLNQSYSDFELIVVDDNSSDDTEEIIAEYEERVQYICHQSNRGAPAARNTGIEEAEGELIAFIDSDDEWARNKLERQVTTFYDSPQGVGVVYTGYYVKHDETLEIGEVPSKRGDIFEEQLIKDWVNPTSTVMVRSECFDKVGKFNTSLQARQDYEMWIRIARHFHFEYIEEPLVTLHVDSNERITENIEPRMSAHWKVINLIESDIQSLPWYKYRKVFGIQHYTMGRYLQKHGEFRSSLSYFLRSLIWYPFNIKAALALILALLRQDTTSSIFIKLKNILRMR